MKQIVSMALPPMELPSVRMAQALNALLRVINPALKALKAWRWTIAGCMMAATAYGASLYDMAYDSTGARIVMAAMTLGGLLALTRSLSDTEPSTKKGGRR